MHDRHEPISFANQNGTTTFSNANAIFDVAALQVNADTPTEAECQPHIAKALNTLKGDSKGINERKTEKNRSVSFDARI